MAIVKITTPSSIPSSPVNYQLQNEHIFAIVSKVNNQGIPLSLDGGKPVIKQGSFVAHGAVLYVATQDTAIDGAFNDGDICWVKLTADGDNLYPSFVKNTSGFSFNHAYGQYLNAGSDQILPFYIFRAGVSYSVFRYDPTTAGHYVIDDVNTLGVGTHTITPTSPTIIVGVTAGGNGRTIFVLGTPNLDSQSVGGGGSGAIYSKIFFQETIEIKVNAGGTHGEYDGKPPIDETFYIGGVGGNAGIAEIRGANGGDGGTKANKGQTGSVINFIPPETNVLGFKAFALSVASGSGGGGYNAGGITAGVGGGGYGGYRSDGGNGAIGCGGGGAGKDTITRYGGKGGDGQANVIKLRKLVGM